MTQQEEKITEAVAAAGRIRGDKDEGGEISREPSPEHGGGRRLRLDSREERAFHTRENAFHTRENGTIWTWAWQFCLVLGFDIVLPKTRSPSVVGS